MLTIRDNITMKYDSELDTPPRHRSNVTRHIVEYLTGHYDLTKINCGIKCKIYYLSDIHNLGECVCVTLLSEDKKINDVIIQNIKTGETKYVSSM